jgi:predicted TIM-barrel fold metal-dependent hydrolase
MSRVMLISSDGHVAPEITMYRPYLESRYHGDFADYLRVRTPILLQDINTPESLEQHLQRWDAADRRDCMWDPARRVALLESEGAVAEVLFPDKPRNDEFPFEEAPFPGCSVELRAAGERAYNRWLADFCRPFASRFAGLVSLQTPMEPEYVLTQLRWAAEQPGIRGVLLPGVGPEGAEWLSDGNEAIWSCCEETGLVVAFHAGAGAPPRGGPHYPQSVAGGMIASIEVWFWTHRALWWLIYGGVLERHPGLKVTFTETGSAWVAEKLATMNWWVGIPYKPRTSNDFLPRRPSEYFRRQCGLGASLLSREEVERRHEIGVNTMMLGLDLPHFEGTLDVTLEYLQRTLGAAGVSEGDTRAILGANAARFYGFDEVELTPVADRVGYAIADVLSPPADMTDPGADFHWVARPAR